MSTLLSKIKDSSLIKRSEQTEEKNNLLQDQKIQSIASLRILSFNLGFSMGWSFDFQASFLYKRIYEERSEKEREDMALYQKIVEVASAKIFLPEGSAEKRNAQKEWDDKGYEKEHARITQDFRGSPHFHKMIGGLQNPRNCPKLVSAEQEHCFLLNQDDQQALKNRVQELTGDSLLTFKNLLKTQEVMARKICHEEPTPEIFCFQEADGLKNMEGVLSSNYAFKFTNFPSNSPLPPFNVCIAYNEEKFDFVKEIGQVERSLAIELIEKNTEKLIAVASAHLEGCNPFSVQIFNGKADSSKGDRQLEGLLNLLDTSKAKVKILAMDGNVTVLHPRLKILQREGYILASKESSPTCTNPFFQIPTRIDWIFVKGDVSTENMPLENIGLNDFQTNPSDHRPVGARIKW